MFDRSVLRGVLILSTVALCWPSAVAVAQSPASGAAVAAKADAFFVQGKHLMADGKYAEACTAFEQSYALDPKLSTRVNLADCRERNRQLATAWRMFSDVAGQLARAKGASASALRTVAQQRAKELAPRLSSLKFRIAPGQPQGFELRVNGTLASPADWERPITVDGGWWSLTAQAPGHSPWSVSFSLREEGDAKEVRVPALEPFPPQEDGGD